MRYFDDNEIILQKALAMRIVDALHAVQGKVQKMAEKIAASINFSETNFSETKEIQKLALYANEMKDKQEALVSAMAIANRIDNLIARNLTRIEYFSNYLKSVGIYNEKFDVKELERIEKEESLNISDETLNLNLYAEGGKIYRYVFDDVFVFENDMLNLSNPVNEKCLMNMSESNLQKLINDYPESVSTLSDQMIQNVGFKKKFLKCIAAYVMDKVKVKSIKDINKSFGNLLSFKIKAIYSAYEYILAVQNLFNVKIKNNLMVTKGEYSEEIFKKLPCNEKSEFIPKTYDLSLLHKAAEEEKKRADEAKAKKDKAMQVIAERFAVCYRVRRKKIKLDE